MRSHVPRTKVALMSTFQGEGIKNWPPAPKLPPAATEPPENWGVVKVTGPTLPTSVGAAPLIETEVSHASDRVNFPALTGNSSPPVVAKFSSRGDCAGEVPSEA